MAKNISTVASLFFAYSDGDFELLPLLIIQPNHAAVILFNLNELVF